MIVAVTTCAIHHSDAGSHRHQIWVKMGHFSPGGINPGLLKISFSTLRLILILEKSQICPIYLTQFGDNPDISTFVSKDTDDIKAYSAGNAKPLTRYNFSRLVMISDIILVKLLKNKNILVSIWYLIFIMMSDKKKIHTHTTWSKLVILSA